MGNIPDSRKNIQVAAGSCYSMVLTEDGTVWTCGENSRGQLGYPTGGKSFKMVEGIQDVVAISAGQSHSMALKSDGTVWTWGDNYCGQLGDGSNDTYKYQPVQVCGLDNVIAISCGSEFGLALKEDGTVWAWGRNDIGQLGNKTNNGSNLPILIEGLKDVCAISAGYIHCLAVVGNDRTLYGWGGNHSGQVFFTKAVANRAHMYNYPQKLRESGVELISAFGSISIVSLQDGRIAAWGYNNGGVIGNKQSDNHSLLYPLNIRNAKAFATGACSNNIIVKLEDGLVYVWGDNSGEFAQFRIETNTPVKSDFFGAKSISSGQFHTMLLMENGEVRVCGYNGYGQFGVDSGQERKDTPIRVFMAAKSIGTISAGGRHCMAAEMYLNSFIPYGWGANKYRQAGNGINENLDHAVKLQPYDVSASFACGGYHTLALSKGVVYSWGRNNAGQLGNDSTGGEALPVNFSGTNIYIESIAAGMLHSMSITKEGQLWAWGSNFEGQLGDGTKENRRKPVLVNIASKIRMADGGYYHTVALDGKGDVWTWGDNFYGQLGDGLWQGRCIPGPVKWPEGKKRKIKAVAAGLFHSLVLGEDGTVWGWGDNRSGQLGNDKQGKENLPVQVAGLPSIKAVAAGKEHSMALDEDGNVWVWGGNSSGQLGNNSKDASPSPIKVKDIGKMKAIAAGHSFSVAVDVDGLYIYAWGKNSGGQLGNGSFAGSLVPVKVVI